MNKCHEKITMFYLFFILFLYFFLNISGLEVCFFFDNWFVWTVKLALQLKGGLLL